MNSNKGLKAEYKTMFQINREQYNNKIVDYMDS